MFGRMEIGKESSFCGINKLFFKEKRMVHLLCGECKNSERIVGVNNYIFDNDFRFPPFFRQVLLGSELLLQNKTGRMQTDFLKKFKGMVIGRDLAI